MADRKYFKLEELQTALEEVSQHVKSPVKGYLIGGFAMMLHEAKTGTKDVDMVFSEKESLLTF